MKYFRPIALLLCLTLLCSGMLAACTTGEQTDESADVSQSASDSNPDAQNKYVDANGKYTLDGLDMPAFNYTETEFRVCVYDNSIQDTYFSEEIGYDLYATTDTVLNEAVKTRNGLIEEKYGVKVVAYCVPDVFETVRQSVMNPMDVYDAAMPFMFNCATLAQDGNLYDLMQYDQKYLHLDAPWWDQTANASFSVGGKLYFTTGDISIMQKVCSGAIAFNKTMYHEYLEGEYGDLYQMVRDHKWTVDVLYEMGRKVTADTDGESGMSYKDRWGLVGANGFATTLYCASGEGIIGKDQADHLTLEFGKSERGIQYAQKVLELLKNDGSWFLNVQTLTGQVDNIWQTSVDVFGENRALFYACAFSAIKKLRAYPNMSDFGLIPVPLSDETQENYQTQAGCTYSYGICIPSDVKNPEFSAYMIEALACGAKNTVTPAYYEVTLKTRDAKDPESEEMLDQYIFKNQVYEIGFMYDFGGVSSMFSTLVANNSSDIASELDSKKLAILAAIKECEDAYALND